MTREIAAPAANATRGREPRIVRTPPSSRTTDRVAPGPRSPAAWQLVRYSQSPLAFLEECAARYGNTFLVRLAGYGQFVMLAEPQAVHDVFRGDPHILHSGEGNQFL